MTSVYVSLSCVVAADILVLWSRRPKVSRFQQRLGAALPGYSGHGVDTRMCSCACGLFE